MPRTCENPEGKVTEGFFLFLPLISLICVMGKKKKNYKLPKDPIKAMKKAARDLELEMGVRFTYSHPHKSKKAYNRKDKSWKRDSGSCYFLFPQETLYLQ